jgi:hypothetical protein
MMVEEGFAEDLQKQAGQLDASSAIAASWSRLASTPREHPRLRPKSASSAIAIKTRPSGASKCIDLGYRVHPGKVQDPHLRDEAKKRPRRRSPCRSSIDALLSHGSPPVPLIQ